MYQRHRRQSLDIDVPPTDRQTRSSQYFAALHVPSPPASEPRHRRVADRQTDTLTTILRSPTCTTPPASGPRHRRAADRQTDTLITVLCCPTRTTPPASGPRDSSSTCRRMTKNLILPARRYASAVSNTVSCLIDQSLVNFRVVQVG